MSHYYAGRLRRASVYSAAKTQWAIGFSTRNAQEQAWQEQVQPVLQDGYFVKRSLAKIFLTGDSPVFELIPQTEVFS